MPYRSKDALDPLLVLGVDPDVDDPLVRVVDRTAVVTRLRPAIHLADRQINFIYFSVL